MNSFSILNCFTITILISSSLSFFVACEKIRFDGYKVLRLRPNTEYEAAFIRDLEKQGVHFWHGPNPKSIPSDILIHPTEVASLFNSLRTSGLNFTEIVPDVQKLLDWEFEENARAATDSQNDSKFKFHVYHTFDEIEEFLTTLVGTHRPIASKIVIGKTFEGRNLTVIKISTGKSREEKPIVWIDANTHAREWISSAVAIYTINAILTGRTKDPMIKSWLANYDFYFLPIHNPDGFVYTHSTNRLWRKTRSNYAKNPMDCVGTDSNRNWEYLWGGEGSSPEPCSLLYAGVKPFSEAETSYTSQFHKTLKNRLSIFIHLHSFGQYVLLPFGVKKVPFPKHDAYMKIAKLATTAMRQRYGTNFTYGNHEDILYGATGTTIDWAEYITNLNLDFSALIELRGPLMEPFDAQGFILPPNEIIPSSLEFIDGLEAIIKAVTNKKKGKFSLENSRLFELLSGKSYKTTNSNG